MIPVFEDRRVLNAINGLLVLFVFISLLFLVRGVLSSGTAGRMSRPGEGQASFDPGERQPESKERFNSASFLRRNLFGISGKPLSGQAGPQQKDDIKLVGTVVTGNGGGYAFFADSEGKQTVVRQGENLAPEETVSRVERDIVEVTGRKSYRLQLIDIKDVYRENVRGSRRAAVKRRYASARGIRRTGEGEYIVDRRQVEDAINNPQSLMTDARLQPLIKGGRQEGFVLKEVRRNGIYHTLGLRNNDVLLRINNYPITDPEAALQAFTALRGADEIVLNIKRNGRRKTLRYHIR